MRGRLESATLCRPAPPLSDSYMLGYEITGQNIRDFGHEFLQGLVVSLGTMFDADEDFDDFWRGQADAALASMGLEL